LINKKLKENLCISHLVAGLRLSGSGLQAQSVLYWLDGAAKLYTVPHPHSAKHHWGIRRWGNWFTSFFLSQQVHLPWIYLHIYLSQTLIYSSLLYITRS